LTASKGWTTLDQIQANLVASPLAVNRTEVSSREFLMQFHAVLYVATDRIYRSMWVISRENPNNSVTQCGQCYRITVNGTSINALVSDAAQSVWVLGQSPEWASISAGSLAGQLVGTVEQIPQSNCVA
jgi:hypothetical protein